MKKTPFKAKQACINDAQGNIITEQEPALERYREYNEQLFAKPLNEPILTIQDYNVSEPVPLYREASSAILHLKRRKAPGVLRWESSRLDTGERTECCGSTAQSNCQAMA